MHVQAGRLAMDSGASAAKDMLVAKNRLCIKVRLCLLLS